MSIAWPLTRTGYGTSRSGRTILGAGLIGLCLLASPSAGAQSKDELDRARALFQEGVALSAANNCAAALTKYRAVAKVKMTAQVAFNIAECEERLGRLVQALGDYRVAAAQASTDSKAKEVTKQVGARVDALEARIPKLTIMRGKGSESAIVELDGTEIGAGQLGSPIPVDPGPHIIVGRVGDKEYSRDTVTIEEKESKTFEVKMTVPVPKKVEGPVDDPNKLPPDAQPAAKGRSRVPGIAVTAAGGVSLILGFVFLGLRGGAISELDKLCGGDTTCPPSAQPTGDKGKLYTGLAEVTIVVGAIGVGTGIALIATSGPPKQPKETAAPPPPKETKWVTKPTLNLVAAAPGAELGGLSLMGTF